MNFEQFKTLFNFKPELKGYIGCELELWLVDDDFNYIPIADKVLGECDERIWTPELSNCQVEVKTDPCKNPRECRLQLENRYNIGAEKARKIGLRLIGSPYAPDFLPLDSFPNAYYIEIANNMTDTQRLAAMRLASLQFHIGCSCLEEAVQVHDDLVKALPRYFAMEPACNTFRRKDFAFHTPDVMPVMFGNVENFFKDAMSKGYMKNPTRNWRWVRIHPIHGTVEFRPLWSTTDFDIIEYLANMVYDDSGIYAL